MEHNIEHPPCAGALVQEHCINCHPRKARRLTCSHMTYDVRRMYSQEMFGCEGIVTLGTQFQRLRSLVGNSVKVIFIFQTNTFEYNSSFT